MATIEKGELEKALRWVEQNWVGQKACVICGNSGWLIGDVVGEMRRVSPGPRWLPKPSSSYPMIVLSCENCGYTLLFNAMVLGVTDQ